MIARGVRGRSGYQGVRLVLLDGPLTLRERKLALRCDVDGLQRYRGVLSYIVHIADMSKRGVRTA